MPEISLNQRWADRDNNIFKIVERRKGEQYYPFTGEDVNTKLIRYFNKNGRVRSGVESRGDLVKSVSYNYEPTTLRLQEGKFYKDGYDRVRGPLALNTDITNRDVFPFTSPNGGRYTLDGRQYQFQNNTSDLKKEVPDPNAKPVEEPKAEEVKTQSVPIGSTVQISVINQEPTKLLKIRVQSFTAEDGRTIMFEPLSNNEMPFAMSHSVKIDGIAVAFVSEFNRVDERLAETFLRLFPYRAPRPAVLPLG